MENFAKIGNSIKVAITSLGVITFPVAPVVADAPKMMSYDELSQCKDESDLGTPAYGFRLGEGEIVKHASYHTGTDALIVSFGTSNKTRVFAIDKNGELSTNSITALETSLSPYAHNPVVVSANKDDFHFYANEEQGAVYKYFYIIKSNERISLKATPDILEREYFVTNEFGGRGAYRGVVLSNQYESHIRFSSDADGGLGYETNLEGATYASFIKSMRSNEFTIVRLANQSLDDRNRTKYYTDFIKFIPGKSHSAFIEGSDTGYLTTDRPVKHFEGPKHTFTFGIETVSAYGNGYADILSADRRRGEEVSYGISQGDTNIRAERMDEFGYFSSYDGDYRHKIKGTAAYFGPLDGYSHGNTLVYGTVNDLDYILQLDPVEDGIIDCYAFRHLSVDYIESRYGNPGLFFLRDPKSRVVKAIYQ